MLPRRFPLLAAVGLLMLASANAAVAREIKYPTKTPFFSFQIPDAWKTQQKGGATDALYCASNDDGSLNVQFYNVENDELGTDLEKFAAAALKAGEVEDIQVVKSGDETVGGSQAVKFVRSTFKRSNGTPFVSLMVFLPMGADRTCAIHCFLPEKQLDGHKDQIDKLLQSIKLLD